MSRTITVEHLARVEGHGGVEVVLDGNDVREVRLDVFEGIRLFEALVVGHKADEVPGIVSRICAICSVGHAVTSILALEKALAVRVSPRVRLLRELAIEGQNVESHALHVFVLALPDVLGHPSVMPLAAAAPNVVRTALRLKKLGNTIQEVVGGRAVHPVNHVVGGLGRMPTLDEMLSLRRDLEEGLDDCRRAAEVLATVRMPDIVDEEIRVAALVPDGESLFLGDEIALSTGERIPVERYRELTNERVVAHSHAKHSAHGNASYMVGALARLTLHGDRIGGFAGQVRRELGLETPARNIVLNNLAQAVEMIHSVERAHRIVTRLIDEGLAPEAPAAFEPGSGQGAAATEVPRGTLFHAYVLDEAGRVVSADVVTPTAQNLLDAEHQMTAAVRAAAGLGDDEIRRRLEIVARAYDPCISCSVHVVRAG